MSEDADMNKLLDRLDNFIDSYDADYSNAGQNISESHKRALREGFWNGWTQHGEEVMKMAREKVVYIETSASYGDLPTKRELVIKLSDLEAIIKELR